MAMEVSWWERRDHADRDALGKAALADCRALRQTIGEIYQNWTRDGLFHLATEGRGS
ncbi:MAG TPA: hypothetical protein VIU62_03355 [Chloroflexota bacterium]|jgi:hypothetical protein